MTSWIKPKTNWISSDYFNPEDYNRIKGNITYLKEYEEQFCTNLSEVSLGDDKTYESLIYAREINNIEDSLETLNLETYVLNIGKKQTFEPNKSTPLWSEFNRIESACLLLYNTMVARKNALQRLSFTLGSQKGIRV